MSTNTAHSTNHSNTVYSLSEIEAQAKKAVRGAGFGWGYAEEMAKAVRFLAAHQLPGLHLLAAYLTVRAEQPEHWQGPVCTGVRMAPSDNRGNDCLCPILTGATLCDAGQDALEHGWTLQQVAYPLLLLPYLAVMSRSATQAVELQWAGITLVCHQGRVESVAMTNPALTTELATQATCSMVPLRKTGLEAGRRGQTLEAADWNRLSSFAQRTYVPATEASRRGAGPAV